MIPDRASRAGVRGAVSGRVEQGAAPAITARHHRPTSGAHRLRWDGGAALIYRAAVSS